MGWMMGAKQQSHRIWAHPCGRGLGAQGAEVQCTYFGGGESAPGLPGAAGMQGKDNLAPLAPAIWSLVPWPLSFPPLPPATPFAFAFGRWGLRQKRKELRLRNGGWRNGHLYATGPNL